MEYLLCMFPITIKVWKFILGQWCWNYRSISVIEKITPVITGVHKCESCKHIFRKFRILTLMSLYILEVLRFIKECHGNLKQNCVIHGRNTRSKLDLYADYCSTVWYQRGVTNMGIKLFSKLPVQIKELGNYKCFKREVKNFVSNNWRIFALWGYIVCHTLWVYVITNWCTSLPLFCWNTLGH
jgi:hypothetical protein